MPSSDYNSAIGGGLKLKGTSSGGIDKKKSKKKKKTSHTDPEQTVPANLTAIADAPNDRKEETELRNASTEGDITEEFEDQIRERAAVNDDGKTEAERRYEERRRKRLDERLRREGVQTHKERVEKLNKYLSGLSEHHDMPRIGPG